MMSSPKKPASPTPVSQDVFAPTNFGNPATGANRWDPMLPGRQSVREGRVNVGHRPLTHRRVYTVTNLTKRINGVPAAVVIDQDFNGGQLAEQLEEVLLGDRLERLVLYSPAFFGVCHRAASQSERHDSLLP